MKMFLKSKFLFRYYLVYLLIILLNFTSCNSVKDDSVLRIAAASNLRYALEEINVEFERRYNIRVEMSAASSGKLTAQIQSGAPFDVFLSANKKYSQFVYEKGFGTQEPKLFCYGLLVYWTIKDIELNKLAELTNANIQKIAMANPKTAPFGMAAVEALKKLSVYNAVKSKLVFAENVSQISQYVLNNNVDVGFTGKSIVLSPRLKGKGKWLDVDEKLYSQIEQYVLLLNKDTTNKQAQKYFDFLFSKKAQIIFKEYGYKTPKPYE